MKNEYSYTASNNSIFMDGYRPAKTLLGAKRKAIQYLRDELYGEGEATVLENGQAVWQAERSIRTGFRLIKKRLV